MRTALYRKSDASTDLLLDEAARSCRTRGEQLTANRRLTLEVLLRASQALGAYEVLEGMQKASGRRLAPPTVYRALEFLLDQKLVARIESRNAFIPCGHSDHPHTCVFFICDRCNASAEVESPKLERLVARDAAALGFKIRKPIIEFAGVCAACSDQTTTALVGE